MMNFQYYTLKRKPLGMDNYIDSDPKNFNPDELKWCEFCAHYGYAMVYRACAYGSVFNILKDGPLNVSFCGHCKYYINKYSEEGKKVQYSKLKQMLLDKYGFKKEK